MINYTLLANNQLFKTLVLCLGIILAFNLGLQAAPTIYEAEAGTLIGTNVSTAVGGYTGSGYVTGFDAANDAVRITVNVASSGGYILTIRYRSPFSDKTQDVYVNGVYVSSVVFAQSSGFTTIQAGGITLNSGNNTIAIVNNWGYMDVDNIGIDLPPSVSITPNVVNPNTDAKTKALYAMLRSQYGNCIFTGQTGYWDELIAISGKTPAVRGFDMQNYSPMNPWGWSGCCAAWGGWDDGTVQQAIDWYNSTGGKGIVTFHWHWFSPSGGTIRTSTFYTNSTNFDVTRAVVPGNQEYTDVLRDIDAIAVQLKRLQTAGVPILWRPLHEAGGAWFWWGARGSAACLTLYDIMYNRLTNFHGLNNLIWVWSTPEPSWYPGNSKVDIIGYDSYPGAYNYSTQKGMFDQLTSIVGGQKMVALTENGPIPNIAQAKAEGATWSFFMSWVDLVASQNSNAHIVDSYNQGCNLADVPVLPVVLLTFAAKRLQQQIELVWQTSSEKDNDRFEIEKSEDGITYQTIGTVKGMINSSIVQNYYYIDPSASTRRLYYRLKQIDVDGKFTYSSVSVVEPQEGTTVTLYPNPTNHTFKISKSDGKFSTCIIRIINAGGSIVVEQSSSHAEFISMDASVLQAGVYTIEIIENEAVYREKLVKY